MEDQPQERQSPKGYLLFNFSIHDPKGFNKYVEAAGSLGAKYKGKVLAFDVTAKKLEGSAESIMAIMEFPTVADAERFYHSDEYTAARPFRIASTSGTVVLAEALP